MLDLLKIKLVAIAKDEGAYLAQWIFHHLHFGFDAIEIYINRTSDNSKRIIESISSYHPTVTYRDLDWVDLCPEATQRNIQYIAYALAYKEAINEGYSHVLFLDIDEMWTPANFETSIKEYIDLYPTSSSISFNWFCELGQNQEFSPIGERITGFLNEHIKTIISTSARVEKIKIHSPIFSGSSEHYIADLGRFVPRDINAQFHIEKPTTVPDAFIIHRMYRSEVEYLACLYRGNPNSKESVGSLYKDNRHGFKTFASDALSLAFPCPQARIYKQQLASFIKTCNLSELNIVAQKCVFDRSTHAISSAAQLMRESPSIATKIFSGCQSQPLINLINGSLRTFNYRVDSIRQEPDSCTLVGWAFDELAKTLYRVIPSEEFRILDSEFIARPDVHKIYPMAHIECGFKLRIQHRPNDASSDIISPKNHIPNSLTAFPSPTIETCHGTKLYYNHNDQRLRHISVSESENQSLFPVFLLTIKTGTFPVVIFGSRIHALQLTPPHIIILAPLPNEKDTFSTLIFERHTNSTLVIRQRDRYASALLGGIFAYDRSKVMNWEKFRENTDPTAPAQSICLDTIK